MSIDVKRLRDLYLSRKLSIAETATAFGVSYSTVWKTLKQQGIPLRSSSKVDADELRRLYLGERWPAKRIGEQFGVSRQAVYDKLRRLSVKLRTPGPVLMKLDMERVTELYVDRQLSLSETSKALGVAAASLRKLLIREGIPLRASAGAGRRKLVEVYNLEIGESIYMQCANVRARRVTLHRLAKNANMRITVNRVDTDGVRVTRIG